MDNLRTVRNLALFVYVGVIVYVILDIVIQLLPPHYSVIRDVESDLSVGPYGFIMRINFLLRGMLSFALVGAISLRAKASGHKLGKGLFFLSLWSLCSFLLAFFNTDVLSFSNHHPMTLTLHGGIHLLLAIIAFVSVAIGVMSLSERFKALSCFNHLKKTSHTLAIITLLSFVVMVLGILQTAYIGLVERVFISSTLLWIFFVAVGLWRHPNSILDEPSY